MLKCLKSFAFYQLAVLMCVMLASCGGEPSDSKIESLYKDRMEGRIQKMIEQFRERAGDEAAAISFEMGEFAIIEKIENEDGTWNVITQVDLDIKNIPNMGNRSQKLKLNLHLEDGGEGWQISEEEMLDRLE